MRSGSGTAFTFCSTLDKLEYLLFMNAICRFWSISCPFALVHVVGSTGDLS